MHRRPNSPGLRPMHLRILPATGPAAVIGLALLWLLLATTGALAQPAVSPEPGHGHVVVQYADHDLAVRSFTFTAPTSGLAALELTGLDVVTAGTSFGPAVCSIGGVGCPSTNCFCGGSKFWSYNFWDGQAWQSYPVGPSGSALADGAVEGWRWGEWGSTLQPASSVTAASRAAEWLLARQSATDGGFGGDSGSVEAGFAIAANHYAAPSLRRQVEAPSLLANWLTFAARYAAQGAGQSGKLAVSTVALGACWPATAPQPAAYYNPATGAYGSGTVAQAWAMLGTAALSQTVPSAARANLANLQQANGGWEWGSGMGSDSNSTAVALQALLAAGEPPASEVITRGLAYLKTAQNADGGFTYDPAASPRPSDANSTAYVVQALLAAGQDPTAAAWTQAGHTPISYLLSLQLGDGSFEWQLGKGSNQLATVQAIPALLGRTYPLAVAEPAACSGLYLPRLRR